MKFKGDIQIHISDKLENNIYTNNPKIDLGRTLADYYLKDAELKN